MNEFKQGDQEIRADRPDMPADYGIETSLEGTLPWSWVDERMAASRNYWIGSTRPDGRPHMMPVWGVWLDGRLYFSTSRSSRKGQNLAANPWVTAHLESGDEVVIFEGVVEEVLNFDLLSRIAVVYGQKYPGYTPEPGADPANVWYGVAPRTVYAWLERDYVRSATRWQFAQ